MVFYQPDDGFVTFDIIRQDDVDTAYWVLQNLVHEESYIRHHLADPIRVWSLTHRPIEQVRLLDSFLKTFKVSTVRYQRRLFHVPTAAIVRRVVIAQSTGHLCFKIKPNDKFTLKAVVCSSNSSPRGSFSTRMSGVVNGWL